MSDKPIPLCGTLYSEEKESDEAVKEFIRIREIEADADYEFDQRYNEYLHEHLRPGYRCCWHDHVEPLRKENKVFLETKFNIAEDYKQTKQKLADYEQALVDFVLEQSHSPKCKRLMPAEVCDCMDRRYYNYDSCLERAREVLTKHKTDKPEGEK